MAVLQISRWFFLILIFLISDKDIPLLCATARVATITIPNKYKHEYD